MIIDRLTRMRVSLEKFVYFQRTNGKVENYYYYLDNEISGVSAADIISCTMNSL
jgi:hypothetical protein